MTTTTAPDTPAPSTPRATGRRRAANAKARAGGKPAAKKPATVTSAAADRGAARKRATTKTKKKPAQTKPAARTKKKKAPARKGPVLAGVDRELAAIGQLDKDLANGGLAAMARALARELDSREHSLTSKASAARSLTGVLERLHAQTPPKAAPRDAVDELARWREERQRSAAA